HRREAPERASTRLVLMLTTAGLTALASSTQAGACVILGATLTGRSVQSDVPCVTVSAGPSTSPAAMAITATPARDQRLQRESMNRPMVCPPENVDVRKSVM